MSKQGTLLSPERRRPTHEAGRRRPPLRVRMLGVLTGVVLVGLVATLAVWIPSLRHVAVTDAPSTGSVDSDRPLVSTQGFVDRTGVRIVHLAVSGGGGLLDLRFQVVDPDKAASIHNQATPPAIVDEATNVVAKDLLMGHGAHKELKTAQTYYLIFENPGNLVQRGNEVTVLLGDAQVEHVVVE